jgi:hypothetical protein
MYSWKVLMKKLLLLSLSVLILTGCATQIFKIQEGSYDKEPTEEEMALFFVGGLAQKQVIDAANICGGYNKIAKVETELRFIDIFLSFLSSGLFTPRVARVYCLK